MPHLQGEQVDAMHHRIPMTVALGVHESLLTKKKKIRLCMYLYGMYVAQ